MKTLWNRSTTIGIANATCTSCGGLGLVMNREDRQVPCDCALRAVFRSCLTGFRECLALSERTASVSWEPCNGPMGGRVFSRKREEYLADFLRVSERSLSKEEYRIFRFHYLLGADYYLCCQKLQMDRGSFFHAIYKLEEKLGRVYAELEPYPLYPLRDYFGGVAHRDVRPARVLRVPVPDAFPLSA